MKNVLVILVFGFMWHGAIGQISGGESSVVYQHKNVLKMSPIELSRAEFQIGYERYFNSRKTSLLTLLSLISGNSGAETREGVQLFLQYRFYLSHLHKETHYTFGMYNVGFYASPYLLGLVQSEKYEFGVYDPKDGEYNTVLVNEEINSVEGGALMGVQLDITKRIVFDVYIGGGVRKSNVRKDKVTEGGMNFGLLDPGYSGVKPRIGLQIGITI